MRALIPLVLVAACGGDDAMMLDPDAGTGSGSGSDGGMPGEDAGSGSGSDGGMTVTGVPPGCVAGRATSNRTDDSTLDQIRVLYVVPSDLADQQHDTSGKICNSARAFATWFKNQSGSSLRFDTAGGLIDIGFVRLNKTDAQMRGTDPNNTDVNTGTAFVRERIERELIAMNQLNPNGIKLYAVYYEGSSVYACGAGAYPPAITARVGTMYLKGMPTGQTMPCGSVRPWGQDNLVPNYIDYGMLHELVHSMGFVPDTSPNEQSFGHVYDTGASTPARDLMYSPRPSSADPGWNIDAGLLLDLNNDDYWARPSGYDLDTMTLLDPVPANAQRPIGWN